MSQIELTALETILAKQAEFLATPAPSLPSIYKLKLPPLPLRNSISSTNINKLPPLTMAQEVKDYEQQFMECSTAIKANTSDIEKLTIVLQDLAAANKGAMRKLNELSKKMLSQEQSTKFNIAHSAPKTLATRTSSVHSISPFQSTIPEDNLQFTARSQSEGELARIDSNQHSNGAKLPRIGRFSSTTDEVPPGEAPDATSSEKKKVDRLMLSLPLLIGTMKQFQKSFDGEAPDNTDKEMNEMQKLAAKMGDSEAIIKRAREFLSKKNGSHGAHSTSIQAAEPSGTKAEENVNRNARRNMVEVQMMVYLRSQEEYRKNRTGYELPPSTPSFLTGVIGWVNTTKDEFLSAQRVYCLLTNLKKSTDWNSEEFLFFDVCGQFLLDSHFKNWILGDISYLLQMAGGKEDKLFSGSSSPMAEYKEAVLDWMVSIYASNIHDYMSCQLLLRGRANRFPYKYNPSKAERTLFEFARQKNSVNFDCFLNTRVFHKRMNIHMLNSHSSLSSAAMFLCYGMLQLLEGDEKVEILNTDFFYLTSRISDEEIPDMERQYFECITKENMHFVE